jgi:hypothetical protein
MWRCLRSLGYIVRTSSVRFFKGTFTLPFYMSDRREQLAEIAELRKQISLLKREEIILKQNGLRFYDAAGWKHDLFHRKGDYKFRYVRCGNRFGKSEMGVAEDVAWARGERPWYPATDPARFAGIPKKAVRILLVVENWEKSEDVFTDLSHGKFWRYISPDMFVDYDKEHGGCIDTIRIKSIWGGVSLIKIQTISSFKQSPQTVESSQWDAIHIDEPCPRELWVGASRGLMDTNGKAWFTCTPLIHPWINRFFIPSGMVVDSKSEPFADDNKFVITGTSYDNKYNTREGIDSIADTWKKEERESRLFGIPSDAGGVVYGEFDPNRHIYRADDLPKGWTAIDKPPAHYMIRAAIDTHERTPQAVLHEATIFDGRNTFIYYYAEQFDSRYVHPTAQTFNEITSGRLLQQTLIDPRAYIESPEDDSTLADVFLSYGIVTERATKDPKRAIQAVKAKLLERTEQGNPTVYFSEDLTETLFEFDNYLWNPKKKNDPLPENNHMMENLGRLLLSHNGYVNPFEENPAHFPQTHPNSNEDLNIDASLTL